MAAPARDSLVALRRLALAAARSCSGATAIEYGMIAGIISVAVIVGAAAVGGTLAEYFQNLADYFAEP